MNKIGVFGIGCIGSVISKYLTANDANQIYYFNRSAKSKISIQQGEKRFRSVIKTDTPEGFKIELDWLIICLKEYHFKNALDDIQLLITDKTRVAIFRNGLNLKDDLAGIVKAEHILETIIDCPIQKIDHSKLRQFKKPKITLVNSKLAISFRDLFNKEELLIELKEDFKKEQWIKLIESSSIGTIQALTKKPCIVFKNSEMLDLYEKLVMEGMDVAQLDGINLPLSFLDELLVKLKRYPDEKGSSMLSDVLAGNHLELNAKSGAILKIASKHKKEIGYTKMLYDILLNYSKS